MSEYKIRIMTPEQALDLFATKGELAAVVAGENGGGGVAVWGSVIGVLSTQADLQAALNAKQNVLTAGNGIDIDDTEPTAPVISIQDHVGTWGNITGTLSDQTDLQTILDDKQNTYTLIPGEGIQVDNTDPDNPIISVDFDVDVNTPNTTTYLTPTLASGARSSGNITMTPLYVISQIQVSKPARVRLYTTASQQAADENRALGVDPDPNTDHGLLLDFSLPTAGSRYLTPMVVGSDFSPAGIPITVDNLDGTSGAITVTVTYWDLSEMVIVNGAGSGGGGGLVEFTGSDSLNQRMWTDLDKPNDGGWDGEHIFAFEWVPTKSGTITYWPGHKFEGLENTTWDSYYAIHIVPGGIVDDDDIPIPLPAQGSAFNNTYWFENQIVEWEVSNEIETQGAPTQFWDDTVPYNQPELAYFTAGQTYAVVVRTDYEIDPGWIDNDLWFSLGGLLHSLNELGGIDPADLPEIGDNVQISIVDSPEGQVRVPLNVDQYAAKGPDALRIGRGEATGYGAMSIGGGTASGDDATSIGSGRAEGNYSVVLGSGTARGVRALVSGVLSNADGEYAIALGGSAAASGNGAISIGGGYSGLNGGPSSYGNMSIAVGAVSMSGAEKTVSVGGQSTSLAKRAIALGADSNAYAPYSSVLGQGEVKRREKVLITGANLEVARSAEGKTQDDASGMVVYAGSTQTGLILGDGSGGKWRITVSNTGVLSAAAYTEPALPYTQRNTSNPNLYGIDKVAMSTTGTYMCQAGYQYIYTSGDGGVNWTQRTTPGAGSWNDCHVSADGTKMIVSRGLQAIWFSTNNGVSWTQRNSTNGSWKIAASSDGTKITTTDGSGRISRSTDSGVTWTGHLDMYNLGLPSFGDICCSSDGMTVYLVADNGFYGGTSLMKTAIYKSVDQGLTFTKTAEIPYEYFDRIECSYDGTKVFVMSYTGMVHRSINSGVTWTSIPIWNNTNPNYTAGSYTGSPRLDVSSDGTKLIASAGTAGIYRSFDTGATWHYEDQTAGAYNWSGAYISPDGTSKRVVVPATGRLYTT